MQLIDSDLEGLRVLLEFDHDDSSLLGHRVSGHNFKDDLGIIPLLRTLEDSDQLDPQVDPSILLPHRRLNAFYVQADQLGVDSFIPDLAVVDQVLEVAHAGLETPAFLDCLEKLGRQVRLCLELLLSVLLQTLKGHCRV